ncbi:hypothetical protein AeRB84_005063 [Aphanomyces euteiches]|nr:hypothetical protein AeRB84_005063 [Aphanomyces euteiches]
MRVLTKCFFKGCANDVMLGSWRCQFHSHRARCLIDDCRNQVYARNLCVRHGGKKKCQVQGCSFSCRMGGFCVKHGAPSSVKLCSEPGCSKHAHLRGKCVRHGGGRRCSVEGCQSFARGRAFCIRHTPVEETPDQGLGKTLALDHDILDTLLQAPVQAMPFLFGELATPMEDEYLRDIHLIF